MPGDDQGDRRAADPQGETPAHVLAAGVAVVAIPRRAPPAGDVGLPGRLVLLAVPEEEAATVSAAGLVEVSEICGRNKPA